MDRPWISSQSVFPDEVLQILHHLGLEAEDLENLVSYPAEQTTPENLPFIVNQIRRQKAEGSFCTVQSQSQPEPSTRIDEMEIVDLTKDDDEKEGDLHPDKGSLEIINVDELMSISEDSSSFVDISETEDSETERKRVTSSLTDVWLPPDSGEVTASTKFQSRNQPSHTPQSVIKEPDSDVSRRSKISRTPPLKRPDRDHRSPTEPQPSTSVIRVLPSGRRGIVLFDSLKGRSNTSITKEAKQQQLQLRLNPEKNTRDRDVPSQDSLSSCNAGLSNVLLPVLYPTFKPGKTTRLSLSTASTEVVAYAVPVPYAMPGLYHRQHPAKANNSMELQLVPVTHQQAQVSSPRLLPYTCPLCLEECTNMADWISHQKSNLHLKNYREAVAANASCSTYYSDTNSQQHQCRKIRWRSRSRSPSSSPRRIRSPKSPQKESSSGWKSHGPRRRHSHGDRWTGRKSRSRSSDKCRRTRSEHRSSSSSSSPHSFCRSARRSERSSRSSSRSPHHRRRRRSAYHHRNASRSRSSSPCNSRRSRSRSPERHFSLRRRDKWRSSPKRYERRNSPRRWYEARGSPVRKDPLASPKRSTRDTTQFSPKIDHKRSSPKRSSLSPKKGSSSPKKSSSSPKKSSSSPKKSSSSPKKSTSSQKKIDKRGSSIRVIQDGKSSAEMSHPQSSSVEETLAQKLLHSAAVQSLPKGVGVEEIVKTLTPALLVEFNKMKSSSKPVEDAGPSKLTKLKEEKATSALKHKATNSAKKLTSISKKTRSQETGAVCEKPALKLPKTRTTRSAKKPQLKNTRPPANLNLLTKIQRAHLMRRGNIQKPILPQRRRILEYQKTKRNKILTGQFTDKAEGSSEECGKFLNFKLTKKILAGDCPTRKADVSQPRPPRPESESNCSRVQEDTTSSRKKHPNQNLNCGVKEGGIKINDELIQDENNSEDRRNSRDIKASPNRVGEECTPNTFQPKPPGQFQTSTKDPTLDNQGIITFQKSETDTKSANLQVQEDTTSRSQENFNKVGVNTIVDPMVITDDGTTILQQKATTYTTNYQNASLTLNRKVVETQPMDVVKTTTVEDIDDSRALQNTMTPNVDASSQKLTGSRVEESVLNKQVLITSTKYKQVQEGTTSNNDHDKVQSIDLKTLMNKGEDADIREAVTNSVNASNISLKVDDEVEQTIEQVTHARMAVVESVVFEREGLPNIEKPEDPLQDQQGCITVPKSVKQQAETSQDVLQFQEETTSKTKNQKTFDENGGTAQMESTDDGTSILKDGNLQIQQAGMVFTTNHQNVSLGVDQTIEPVTLGKTPTPKDPLQDKRRLSTIPKSVVQEAETQTDALKVQEETSSRTNSQKVYLEVKEDGSFCVIKISKQPEVHEEATTSPINHQNASVRVDTKHDGSFKPMVLDIEPNVLDPLPPADVDHQLKMLLALIKSVKSSSSSLALHGKPRTNDVLNKASIQPNEKEGPSIYRQQEKRGKISTKSIKTHPPKKMLQKKINTAKTKSSSGPQLKKSPVSETKVAVRFLTPGERFIMCLHLSPLQCINPKSLIRSMKVLLVKELPAYVDGFYTERDVAELFVPFGFQYPEENIHNIYVFPEARMGFVLLPNVAAVQSAMESASGRGLFLKRCRVSLHILDLSPPSMKPIHFYNFLMKKVGYIVTDGGKSTVYVENISQSEAMALRELFKTNGRVRNYLPLLNKVFVELQCELDADILGVWFSLTRGHTYRVYRLKAPVSQSPATPPKPRISSASGAVKDPFLDAIVAPTISSVPSGSSAPFWLTVTTPPFVFATLSPWFNVPDHVTIGSEKELERVSTRRATAHTVMLTGLPHANYQHEDVTGLLRPYFPEASPSTFYYNVSVLPLQSRAFVHFLSEDRRRGFVRDALRNPLSVRGRRLSVHYVLDDMKAGFTEDQLFVNLMRWSNAGSPRPDALQQRLLSVEVAQFSVDVLKAVMKEVASVAPVVDFLPLSNRIIVEMAEPGHVTRLLQEVHFPVGVSSVLSAENMKQRLQRVDQEVLPPLPVDSSEAVVNTRPQSESLQLVRCSK